MIEAISQMSILLGKREMYPGFKVTLLKLSHSLNQLTKGPDNAPDKQIREYG
ncbi:hypothetical protein D3C76_1219260 [compost metagenome]